MMDETMEKLLDRIMILACESDYTRLSRTVIATDAGVSVGLVSYYFGKMDDLRKIIVKEAVKRECPGIVARAILQGDISTKDVPKKLLDKCKQLFS